MARRIAIAAVLSLCGYCLGAVLGGLLVAAVSTNHFDRQMEVVMTGAFVTGPIGALIGFIGGFSWSRRHGTLTRIPHPPQEDAEAPILNAKHKVQR